MITKEILPGLFRGKSGKDGIWDYLGRRAEAKYGVELEQDRNEGTPEAMRSLMPGTELHEGGPDRVGVIRAPGAASPSLLVAAAVPAPPDRPGELEPAPQQAQGPADES